MNNADSVPDPANPVPPTNRLAQYEHVHRIVETSDQLMLEIDADGHITYVNQAAHSCFGMAPAACLGQPLTAFVHPDVHENVRQWLSESSLNQQRHASVEIRVVHRDGTLFRLLCRATFHRDSAGRPQSITIVTHDITHLYRQWQKVQEDREIVQSVIDSLPQTIFWKDREGRFLGGNQRLLAEAGLTDRDELIGKTDADMLWRNQAARYQAEDRAVMINGRSSVTDESVIGGNGTAHWRRISRAPLVHKGDIIGVAGISDDVTEMKQQAEELHIFKTLIEKAHDGIAIADRNLRLTYTNHAFSAMLDDPSLVGRSVVELVCADNHATLVTAARTAECGQAVWDIVRYVRSDGTLMTAHAGILGLRDRQGNNIGYALVNRDMTSQLQAETALLRSEQRNRALLAAIPDLMFVLSADGIFLDYKADKLLLPPEMFLNRHVNEVLPPPLASQTLFFLDRLKHTGEMQEYEYQLEFMGQLEEYEARMVPLQDGVLVLARNITAQRHAERERAAIQEQIIQAQQAALRELSTPLLPITDRVVVMPLIGAIDSVRAQQIMEGLLQGVSRYQAQAAIIDITGVKVVDTQVAGVLVRAAQAVRMLGAWVILTGISPEIAQTLVHIGTELRDVKTKATLQEGIRYAMTVGNRNHERR